MEKERIPYLLSFWTAVDIGGLALILRAQLTEIAMFSSPTPGKCSSASTRQRAVPPTSARTLSISSISKLRYRQLQNDFPELVRALLVLVQSPPVLFHRRQVSLVDYKGWLMLHGCAVFFKIAVRHSFASLSRLCLVPSQ